MNLSFKICFLIFVCFVVVNSLFLGMTDGIGLSVMLLVHEYGHMCVMRKCNIEHSYPIFIPMVGAIVLASEIDDEETAIKIAFGGPLVGTIGVCIVGIVYMLTKQSVWLDVCILGMLINFINMCVTILPFDGGRMLNRLIPRSRELGLILPAFITICFKTLTLFTLLVVFFYFKGSTPERSTLPKKTQLKWGLIWLSTVIFQIVFTVLILKV